MGPVDSAADGAMDEPVYYPSLRPAVLILAANSHTLLRVPFR